MECGLDAAGISQIVTALAAGIAVVITAITALILALTAARREKFLSNTGEEN